MNRQQRRAAASEARKTYVIDHRTTPRLQKAEFPPPRRFPMVGLVLMVLLLFYASIFLLVLGQPAKAGQISISGTMVTLSESSEPGVVATVTMDNVSLNGSADNGTYEVAMSGLSVDVVFLWERDLQGADSITVIPPDGLICKPSNCQIVAPEGSSGKVDLLEYVGM